jgi:DNA-binding beta-propeller fold protein YncE
MAKRLFETWAVSIAALMLTDCSQAQVSSGSDAHLVLEHIINLPDVKGRIDHLAIDPAHQLLAVAELGNNTVDVIDLAKGTVAHRLTGLREPQGVAYDLTGQILIVAEGGGKGVKLFDAKTDALLVEIALGDDSDDVRIDPRNGHVLVGYGDGALAVIDVERRKVLSRFPLPAHPEGFQIDERSGQVFVNLPNARTIAVVDIDKGQGTRTWNLPASLMNFPMALNAANRRVVAVFRVPARIAMFDESDGRILASQPTCGDSDDVYVDDKRQQFYVTCGEGVVEVFDCGRNGLRSAGRVQTRSGARTSLFVPEIDRLFVAARGKSVDTGAEILIMKPAL